MVFPVTPSRRAVIDVGTNSVKLLVADVTEESVIPILETSEQTRLGRGFYQSHLLQPAAIDLTASVVKRFARQAAELGAAEVRPFATSAARDARNADALVAAIREHSDLGLVVIPGETEAEWAFQGAATHPVLDGHAFLLVDVGGGSTEFILGQRGHRHYSGSFPLGTVRTIESIPHGDPPSPADLVSCRESIGRFIRAEVQPQLDPALRAERARCPGHTLRLAGVGGTASVLAAMEARLTAFDRDRIEATQLTLDQVMGWTTSLWEMPLAERRQLPGLPPPRADVILAGVVIFEAIMSRLGFEELRVTTRGLRFAALRRLWDRG